MGFFDKLFGGKSKDENTAKFTNQSKTVLTPLQGKVLAQADIPDETFAQGILGPGCGIEPTGDTVYAPFDGTVTQIATTLHAVGITSNDGIELLIHVGMDTVDMKGQGFTALVKENQKVSAGTPLLKVDLDAVRAAGHPTATAIIVTDGAGDEVKMLAEGDVQGLIFCITKRPLQSRSGLFFVENIFLQRNAGQSAAARHYFFTKLRRCGRPSG